MKVDREELALRFEQMSKAANEDAEVMWGQYHPAAALERRNASETWLRAAKIIRTVEK